MGEEESLRFLFVGVVVMGFGVVFLGFFLLPGVEAALAVGFGVSLGPVAGDLSFARRWVRALGVHSGMR